MQIQLNTFLFLPSSRFESLKNQSDLSQVLLKQFCNPANEMRNLWLKYYAAVKLVG